jgi:hypothetical protein
MKVAQFPYTRDWVSITRKGPSRRDFTKVCALTSDATHGRKRLSIVPNGTIRKMNANPAMNCWAIFIGPRRRFAMARP